MRNALIRNNVVVNVITSAEPRPQDYQAVVEVSGVYVEPGWLWNGGTSFTKMERAEDVNERTLRQQAENALTANLQDIADADAWLSGVGAGNGALTAAQLSPAVRQIMRSLRASKKAENGAIRLLLGRFESTS
jgi:hypothetical protein